MLLHLLNGQLMLCGAASLNKRSAEKQIRGGQNVRNINLESIFNKTPIMDGL